MDSGAEVVVVGGGPAGAATAALLAGAGRDVLLLERSRFPREKPCAEYFSPGVADLLGRLGVLERVLSHRPALPLGMRIFARRQSFLLSYDGAAALDAPIRTALGMPRPLFDQLLLENARSRGARVREGVLVLGAVRERGRVTGVRVRSPAGAQVVTGSVVVGADGLNSAVARSLGVHRPARWPRRLGLVARYQGPNRIAEYGGMFTGAGRYCGLAPVGEGLVNVGLVVPLDDSTARQPRDTFFEAQLTRIPGVLEALGQARRVTPIRGIGPLARRVTRTAGPGYLLVGDAAGFLDPFTGEGVYRALRGAELAAAAVQAALSAPEDDGREAARAYEQSRRAAFADKERVCYLVQLALAWPPLFDRVVARLDRDPHLRSLLAGVLGDYQPAATALRPSVLWSLLGP